MNNDEARKYLRMLEKKRPSLEVFERMVQILTNAQERIKQLQIVADTSLLKTFKTI